MGFHVGHRSEIGYLILQAHYATPLQDKDSSGVNLLYTLNPLKNVAGIFLMAASEGMIFPNKSSIIIIIIFIKLFFKILIRSQKLTSM